MGELQGLQEYLDEKYEISIFDEVLSSQVPLPAYERKTSPLFHPS
jgi:hypothetical protein